MARKTKIPPPDALLCERCGYDLAGLRRADDCPECGKAVVESLASESVDRSIRIWLTPSGLARRAVLYVFRPVKSCGRLRVRTHHTWVLTGCTLVCVSAVPGLMLAVLDPRTQTPAGTVLVIYPSIFVVLLLLTWVESLGIRFFGRRREWRITKDVAGTVVGHASCAWVLSAVGVGVVWGIFSRGHRVIGPVDSFHLALFLAILPGLLWFETLVWIGVRKLRFANIPGSERHLADHGQHGLEARATEQGGVESDAETGVDR